MFRKGVKTECRTSLWAHEHSEVLSPVLTLNIGYEFLDDKTGKWFDKIVKYIIPVEFAALVIWWFYQSIASFDREGWWNPFHTYSVATCIFQWGLIIIILLILNKVITERVFRKD